MTEQAAATTRVARLYAQLAPVYDSSGVAYFAPMARRLVELLEPRPGEHALDLGCGRGAASLPLAAAVGPQGHVTAADLVPEMVHALAADARELGVPNLVATVLDASAPALAPDAVDVLSAAAVVSWLPDPEQALTRWLALLRPGGRLGVTTLGAQDPTWAAVDSLFNPYRPAGSLGAQSDEVSGLGRMLQAAGATDVRTVTEPVRITLADAEQWRAFTMTTDQLEFWQQVPPQEQERLFTRARFLLEPARDAGGRIVLSRQVHYTLARRPD